jgi:hypothetical protein
LSAASHASASSADANGSAAMIVARAVGTGSGSASATLRGRFEPISRRSGAPSVFSAMTDCGVPSGPPRTM